MQASSYGAVGASRDPENEAKRPPVWESNGSPTALLIGVLSTYGYHFMVLLAHHMGVHVFGRTVASCAVGGPGGVTSEVGAYACEYSKAFLLCFPVAASAVLMLLAGRDLLQKRLYYGLLKAQGVLEFCETHAHEDRLMAYLLVCAIHVLLFTCLSSPLLHQLYGLVATSVSHAQTVAEKQVALVEQILSVQAVLLAVVPIVLLCVCSFHAYDIQGGLLPLSRYVADADDALRSLAGLRPMRDAAVLSALRGGLDAPTSRSSEAELNAAIVAAVGRNHGESVVIDAAPGGLLCSLWPAHWLLAPARGEQSKGFRRLWLSYAALAITWLTWVSSVLLRCFRAELVEAFELSQWRKLAQLPAYLAHFALVAAVIASIVQAARAA